MSGPVMRSPECVTGKHENCDGSTWDAQRDAEAPDSCVCTCHTPTEKES